MFVLLMMPHVGPMIRQYNVFYSVVCANNFDGWKLDNDFNTSIYIFHQKW